MAQDNSVLVLLVLAIVVSAAGTILLLSKTEPSAIGAVTGVARVNITSAVAIVLPVSVADFGNKFQGDADNTTDDVPPPLTIRNDGSVRVNVSVSRAAGASVLFSGTGSGDNTQTFQFKFDTGGEGTTFDFANSVTSFRNVTGSGSPVGDALAKLNFSDSSDEAEIDLLIRVPTDEPSGQKNTTLEFIAEQAE